MDPNNIHVLVIDDETSIRENIVAYLEDEGFVVDGVESAEAALSMMPDHNFDVGIVDIRLPGMDGDDLIVEASKRQPWMKVIIHTGSAGYSLPGYLKDLNVKEEHVLRKPLDDISFISRLIFQLLEDRV